MHTECVLTENQANVEPQPTKHGFSKCDSTAVRAISKKYIGSLPLAAALGCSDIGEAKLEDGRRVIITWGRNVHKSEQFWFAHNTSFIPVWVGAGDGSCELIIGDTFGNNTSEDWIWLGIRIAKEDGSEWAIVDDTDYCNSASISQYPSSSEPRPSDFTCE